MKVSFAWLARRVRRWRTAAGTETNLERSHVCPLGARRVWLNPGLRVHVSARIFNMETFHEKCVCMPRTRDMIVEMKLWRQLPTTSPSPTRKRQRCHSPGRAGITAQSALPFVQLVAGSTTTTTATFSLKLRTRTEQVFSRSRGA